MYGLTTKTIYKMIRQDKVNSLSGRNGRSCIIDDEEGSKFYYEVTAKIKIMIQLNILIQKNYY